MTRVAHVITRMIVGGAQENTLFTVLGLAALPDYQAWLVTGPETGAEGDLLEGRAADLDISYIPSLVRSIRPAADARALVQLGRHFRQTRPDIVHTHATKAGVLGRASASAAGVPLVVHTLHSLVFHPYQRAAVRAGYRTVKRALVPLTDHYVSVSDNIRERAIAAGIGRPERHSTVRSGFLTTEFTSKLVPRHEARERFGLPADRVVVGAVARLFPLKGHAEILEAAAHLVARRPEVLFAFVGSGVLRPELERIVREAGLDDHVRFLGRVPPAEVAVAFSAFDILVHASLREGLARVIPQSVLAGLPVVCYDLDGSSEVVSDGVNGFLVPPRDPRRLAERLEVLVADATLRERMGGVGKEEIARQYSVDVMVQQLDELYRRLLAQGPAARGGRGRRARV